MDVVSNRHAHCDPTRCAWVTWRFVAHHWKSPCGSNSRCPRTDGMGSSTRTKVDEWRCARASSVGLSSAFIADTPLEWITSVSRLGHCRLWLSSRSSPGWSPARSRARGIWSGFRGGMERVEEEEQEEFFLFSYLGLGVCIRSSANN